MFGKKIKEMSKDPEKAMDYADKSINKGITGFMTKAFMGKDFVNDVNQSLERGREAMAQAAEYQKAYQNPEQFGPEAAAAVMSIQDTGKLINYNPVVILRLQVQPQAGEPFETTAEAIVSKIAIPRVGDMIRIRYSPTDHTKIVVL